MGWVGHVGNWMCGTCRRWDMCGISVAGMDETYNRSDGWDMQEIEWVGHAGDRMGGTYRR